MGTNECGSEAHDIAMPAWSMQAKQWILIRGARTTGRGDRGVAPFKVARGKLPWQRPSARATGAAVDRFSALGSEHERLLPW